MKRNTLLIASGLLFLSFYHTHAQSYVGAKIGGFFGATSIEMIGDLIPMDWKMGTEAGITAEKTLINEWSMLTGLQYSNRGFSIRQGTDFSVFGINIPVAARADFNLHYMEMPLLLKYTYPLGGVNFYGTAGGALSYATSGRIETKANLILDLNLGSVDIDFSDDNLNRWNTAMILGIGVEQPVVKGKLFLDIKYNHGLSDLVGNSIIDFDVKNRGFSLGLGYAMAF